MMSCERCRTIVRFGCVDLINSEKCFYVLEHIMYKFNLFKGYFLTIFNCIYDNFLA